MYFTKNIPNEKVSELLGRLSSGNTGLPTEFCVTPEEIKCSTYSGIYSRLALNTMLVVECKTVGTIKIATYGFWINGLCDIEGLCEIEGLPSDRGIDVELSSFELHTTSMSRSETTDHISEIITTTVAKKIEIEYSKNIPIDESGYDSYDIFISHESTVKTEG